MLLAYKVVKSNGELSQNYAFGGAEKQRERLIKDGIAVDNGKVDLKLYKWNL